MVTQLPYPCIVWATILALATFPIPFLLGYLIPPRIVFRKPEIKIVRLYTVKEDGSIESIEPVELRSLPPEKQRVVEEKIKALEEELKHEVVQKLTEEWRRNRKRRLLRALQVAVGLTTGAFIGLYIGCRLIICPQCVP